MLNYVITGGPGAGKSTLLEALRVAGFYGSDEVSRQLIQELVAAGSSCLPWMDLPCFARRALDRMILAFESVPAEQPIAFFDRGIPDIIAYLQVGGQAVPDLFYRAAERYRYQREVLVAPPWETIYVNDAERWQTFAEAEALHRALVGTYQDLGYSVVELPRVAVAGRVAFVKSTVGTPEIPATGPTGLV